MPFPLIPFVAGAALGSLATYFFQDDDVRRGVKNTAEDVTDKVKDAAEVVSDKLKDTASSVSHKVSSGLDSLQKNSSANPKPDEVGEPDAVDDVHEPDEIDDVAVSTAEDDQEKSDKSSPT